MGTNTIILILVVATKTIILILVGANTTILIFIGTNTTILIVATKLVSTTILVINPDLILLQVRDVQNIDKKLSRY